MLFFLIRHGTTDWNKIRRLQGREDIPLNAEGLMQAEKCAEYMAHENIDLILTSPLSRAAVMAEMISEKCGGVPVIHVDGLTERDYGVLSGQIPPDIFFPDESAEGLEPLSAVAERFLKALADNAGRGGRIAVVSHGGSINAALGAMGLPKRIKLYNGSVTKVSFDGSSFTIDELNIATS